MPRSCPVCWLNHDDGNAVLAALLCGESYYSIAERFHLPPMAAWRHERRCLVGPVSKLRGVAQVKGPRAVRRQLVAGFPLTKTSIDAWLAGNRPVMPARDDYWPELNKLRRQRKTLEESIK